MPLAPSGTRLAVALLALVLLAPLAAPAGAQPLDTRFPSDEEAAAFTFARYRNAILTRDGATAYDCVDARTRTYYDRIADFVKYGEPEELQALTFTDLTIILSSRQFIAPEVLAEMDGAALFKHAVDNGWTDREIVAAGIGKVEFRDGVGYGRALLSRVETLFHWIFRFEDEKWRLDLATQLATIDEASAAMLASEGLTAADLAFQLLVRGAGPDVVTADIWNPPFQR